MSGDLARLAPSLPLMTHNEFCERFAWVKISGEYPYHAVRVCRSRILQAARRGLTAEQRAGYVELVDRAISAGVRSGCFDWGSLICVVANDVAGWVLLRVVLGYWSADAPKELRGKP